MEWALISVTDKTGVVELGHWFRDQGMGLLASGGTARHLSEAGLEVTRVESLTGFDALLGGRVKTLHPRLYAGILSREDALDRADRESVEAPVIAAVVVDLYAFEEALAESRDLGGWVEAIDIGGVSLIRAAAKNYRRVMVVTSPQDYAEFMTRPLLERTEAERLAWAARAFRHMAYYDAVIADALWERAENEPFGRFFVAAGRRAGDLRYGENPHQAAGWYRFALGGGIPSAEVLQGKPLSYNNVLDADAAWRLVEEFDEPAVVAVKHQIPCGVGLGATIAESAHKAYASDPVSIFGGIVAANGTVDEATARRLTDGFLEVVLAPDYDPAALAVLSKKKNLRVLRMPSTGRRPYDLRVTAGGFVTQRPDQIGRPVEEFRHVAGPVPDFGPDVWRDIRLAWTTVAHVRSNAIVVAREGMTAGIGGGQTNRIDAARHALSRAGDKARGGVLASDAFFPFGDVVAEAAASGIRVIVEPGGSIRDDESVAGANTAGITLLFTDERHFRH